MTAATLDRCTEFLIGFVTRRARSVVPLEYGFALFDAELPRAWDLNAVWATAASGLAIRDLAARTDDLQGAAGIAHRRLVVFGDEDRRPTSKLDIPEWEATSLLVMPKARRGQHVEREDVVELRAEQVEPFWIEGLRASFPQDDETVRQLVAAQHLRRRAAAVRYFAVVVDDVIVSTCELFSFGGVAQIESLMTVEHLRGRGHATAVVARASEAAVHAGDELVFLLADEADRPRGLYEALGFEVAGSFREYTRLPQPAGG